MERSDPIALIFSILGHIALFGALAIASYKVIERPERSPPIAVTLVDEVGLVDTSPRPNTEAATSVAPELGDIVPPPEELEAAIEPPVTPDLPEQTSPSSRTVPSSPKPPKEKAKAAAKPKQPRPVDRSGRRRPDQRRTGPRLGKNFLDGVSDKESLSKNTTPPGQKAGPKVQASLLRAITSQLKPKWRSPSGADVELLVTTVDWRLDKSGRVIGKPRCSAQKGVNASNRPQKDLHCERAIRAVLEAQPFTGLPEEFYSEWDNVSINFDRKL